MSPSSCGLPRFTSLPPRLQRPQTWLYGRGVLLFPRGSSSVEGPSPSRLHLPDFRGAKSLRRPPGPSGGEAWASRVLTLPVQAGLPPRAVLRKAFRGSEPTSCHPLYWGHPPASCGFLPQCLSWVQCQVPSHCSCGGAVKIPRLWGTALVPTWLGGPRRGACALRLHPAVSA